MDILDIDEMLKDDSFHFLEEKNPDDVSNIIQQWKNQDLQQQQHNETYKLDSRTFTRPKRRSAVQKLETQFLNIGNGSESQQRSPATPVLNVQIGGQIRTPLSARSMLQDTSPPSSICSMDTSLDNLNMDNSLITSADFTHLNFLISTPSLEASINFSDKNCAGYTLSDMIRDRKALESLTLSADDGTMIKDSQISQIDDISLSLLKGSSGCNSMANSADSVEGNQYGFNTNFNDRTMQIIPTNETSSYQNQTLTASSNNEISGPDSLQKTMVLNADNNGSDTTFTLMENGKSFIINRKSEKEMKNVIQESKQFFHQMPLNVTQNMCDYQKHPSEGDPLDNLVEDKLKTVALNETICVLRKEETQPYTTVLPSVSDETFDCQMLQEELQKLEHTPENSVKNAKSTKMYESTPHTMSKRNDVRKNSYTPAIRKIVEDANISPIIAMDTIEGLYTREPISNDSPKSTNAASAYCASPVSRYSDVKLLENIENPNKTYNRRSLLRQQQLEDECEQRHKNEIELQNIMDLAQAEAELLNNGNDDDDDEQQFEHMLDELSRIKLNPEQVKMQKSLEKIKKRFNCSLNQGDQDAALHAGTSTSSSEYGSGHSNTFTSETRQETLNKLRNTLRDTSSDLSSTRSNGSDLTSSGSGGIANGNSFIISSSLATSVSSTGERLLNRRSRLNDDFNLMSVKQLSQNLNGTTDDTSMKSTGNENECINTGTYEMQKEGTDKFATSSPSTNIITEDNDAAKYKLTEQRERDRDRFKTIKIVRNRNDDIESATQTKLNVPCIDDDQDDVVGTKLEEEKNVKMMENKFDDLSTENSSTKSEMNVKSGSPQRFSRSDLGSGENARNKGGSITAPTSGLRQPEARSLSRPRYISGLQKFTVVSKAVSAGDLEGTESNVVTAETKTSQLTKMYDAKKSNIPSKPANKIKSPMGVKAKSLHNLAYNNQGNTTASGVITQTRISAFGLRKINSGGFGFEQQRTQKQQQQQSQQTRQISEVKQKTTDGGFKRPLSVFGLQSNTLREKPPSRSGTAGIARPSSGYYSLNVTAKADVILAAPVPDAEEIKQTKIGVGTNTGIPKPSGIRPPNKRSGLPRPSSMVRR